MSQESDNENKTVKDIFKIAVSLEDTMQYQLLTKVQPKENSQNLIMSIRFHHQLQN